MSRRQRDNWKGGKGKGQPTGDGWWAHRSFYECGECGVRFLKAERLFADIKKHDAKRHKRRARGR